MLLSLHSNIFNTSVMPSLKKKSNSNIEIIYKGEGNYRLICSTPESANKQTNKQTKTIAMDQGLNKSHKNALRIKQVEGLFYSLLHAATSEKVWQHMSSIVC